MSLLSPNLEAFVHVAKLGTVIQAAARLGLTQTAVTQRLRGLENSLGVTLFTRTRKGMHPTTEGEALLHYCEGAEELETVALARLNQSGQTTSARITIVGPSSFLRSRVIPGVRILRRIYPQLYLSIQFCDRPAECFQSLKSGEASIAILDPPLVTREMDSKLLKPQRYFLVGPPSWKKRPLNEIISEESIVDFDIEDRMTINYLQKYKLTKFLKHQERHFCNNTDGLLAMILQKGAYSVLPSEFIQSYLSSGQLINLHPTGHLDVRLAVAWYPRPNMPAFFKATLDHLDRYSRAIPTSSFSDT